MIYLYILFFIVLIAYIVFLSVVYYHFKKNKLDMVLIRKIFIFVAIVSVLVVIVNLGLSLV